MEKGRRSKGKCGKRVVKRRGRMQGTGRRRQAGRACQQRVDIDHVGTRINLPPPTCPLFAALLPHRLC